MTDRVLAVCRRKFVGVRDEAERGGLVEKVNLLLITHAHLGLGLGLGSGLGSGLRVGLPRLRFGSVWC